MCPMGAIAIYLHWLQDHYKLAERIDINWALNSSWRKVPKACQTICAQTDMFIYSGSVCVWRVTNKTVHRLESVQFVWPRV